MAKLRRIAKKGTKLARKVASSKIAREIARREIEIVSDMLAKAAKRLKSKAKKMNNAKIIAPATRTNIQLNTIP